MSASSTESLNDALAAVAAFGKDNPELVKALDTHTEALLRQSEIYGPVFVIALGAAFAKCAAKLNIL